MSDLTLMGAFAVSVLVGTLCGTCLVWRSSAASPVAFSLGILGGASTAVLIFGALYAFSGLLFIVIGPVTPAQLLAITIMFLAILMAGGLLLIAPKLPRDDDGDTIG